MVTCMTSFLFLGHPGQTASILMSHITVRRNSFYRMPNKSLQATRGGGFSLSRSRWLADVTGRACLRSGMLGVSFHNHPKEIRRLNETFDYSTKAIARCHTTFFRTFYLYFHI